jgi:transposase
VGISKDVNFKCIDEAIRSRSSNAFPEPAIHLRLLGIKKSRLVSGLPSVREIVDRAVLSLKDAGDSIDAAITQIDQEVDAQVEPFRAAVQLLTTIPGINELSACVILAEIGRDMGRFPTTGHLISWAGLCPKNDESAGKRRSIRMRKGAPWLKTTLVQCAWAAARKKASYLQAQFHRLRARRGAKKAIGAVAASILTAAFHMLKNGTLYEDLGPDHFDRRAQGKQVHRLINRLRDLGSAVQITPVEAAA